MTVKTAIATVGTVAKAIQANEKDVVGQERWGEIMASSRELIDLGLVKAHELSAELVRKMKSGAIDIAPTYGFTAADAMLDAQNLGQMSPSGCVPASEPVGASTFTSLMSNAAAMITVGLARSDRVEQGLFDLIQRDVIDIAPSQREPDAPDFTKQAALSATSILGQMSSRRE
jgi:hypothetical protein